MKPSIPRGTRDFGPAEMQKRQYIFNILKTNFQLFGYAPIETPAMENLATLMGKYGDEGDKLVYKIRSNKSLRDSLDSDKVSKLNELYDYWLPQKSDKGLRYDLTVPFARYVVMNHHNITFPFKRYQIQPVWRGDNPQRGRYREFYQCDADIIGSSSLINELELIAMMDKSFAELNIPVKLKLNNRKILSGIAEIIGMPEKITDITVAIDKLDKIGINGVNKELQEKGIDDDAIKKLQAFINFSVVPLDDNHLTAFKSFFEGKSEIGLKGYEELCFIKDHLKHLSVKHIVLELDITLARGLNYYTGTIFEAKANAGTFTPSILGGGRYDDLTGIFGLKGLSGVGISFGVDRIYDVMEELNLFPTEVNKVSTTKLLLAYFSEAEQAHCIGLAAQLRTRGINTEVYPDVTKMKKQFEYADKKQIPFVGVIGSNEISNNTIMLKNMSAGTQEEVGFEKLVEVLI